MTVLQRVDLNDRIALEPSASLRVEGFDGDTIVRSALEQLADRAGVEPRWRARIWKAIPVAAGLGGGSTDAATALGLANGLLASPLPPAELEKLAASVGADVPFFLRPGPQLGSGDGSTLSPLDLPQNYWVVLVLPAGARKESTAVVYRHFDERSGEVGYEGRRLALLDALGAVRCPLGLAALPPSDLASSPLAADLVDHGAFRAGVSGAGPAVYGLFLQRSDADAAARAFRTEGSTWITQPCR